jgi:hypothetical protein
MRSMERRTLNRVVQRIAAKFQAGSVRGEGYLKNVSKKGMFLRTGVLPAVGSEVRVFLRDRRGVDVEIVGKVAWTTKQLPPGAKAQPGFGISIDRDDPAFVEFFEQILFS